MNNQKGIMCVKHQISPLDVWYDCHECLNESQEWAEKNGYDQCVSHADFPDYRNTDRGYWVTKNIRRWQIVEITEDERCT